MGFRVNSPADLLQIDLKELRATCELCSSVIRMGPVYEGRYVADHDAIVCNSCWAADRNGWRSELEQLPATIDRKHRADDQS
jgi:hypothetical protein